MDRGRALDAARREIGLSVTGVWRRYFGLGGTATPADIAAYLEGNAQLSRIEHDTLAHAINEAFTEVGMNHPVPYSEGSS